MAASLTELLLPQVIMDLISRIRGGRGPLAAFLGFGPNRYDAKNVSLKGPNTMRGSGALRSYTYRIFDKTRVPMKGRAPGTGPATVSQNPMGQNTVQIARFHQKIPLSYELLGNLSPMIGPNSQIDEGGQNYIAQQTEFMAEQGMMMLEMLAAGMLRNSLYFIQSGDNWLPSFTAPTGTTVGFQINFQVPTTNQGQLANNMGTVTGGLNLIQVPWNNPGAPIFSDIENMKAAYQQLHGYAITDVWLNSTLVPSILTNQQLRNIAGTATQPFTTYRRENDGGMEDTGPENREIFILQALPMIRWHTCDDVLALNTDVDPSYSTAPATATLAKEVPDNQVIITCPPSKKWVSLYEGGEYVVENPGMPGALRMGWYAWHEYVTQPSAVELITLLNAVPALYIPKIVLNPTVIF